MKKFVSVYLLLMVGLHPLWSQDSTGKKEKEKPKLYLNAGSGIHFYSCLSQDYDFIRSGVNYYSSGYYNGANTRTLKWFFTQVFADLKLEYRSNTDKFWISSGLRYTNLRSSLGRYSSYYSTGSDFYYINMNKESLETTEFYRVKNIDYSAHYAGIPLEVRYTPFEIRFFRLFFKAGADINFMFKQTKDVQFQSSEMDINEDDVLALFNSSPKYFGSAYLGAGIQLGKPGKPAFRIESSFPAFVFSTQSFGLVEPEFGGGVMLSLLLPLK